LFSKNVSAELYFGMETDGRYFSHEWFITMWNSEFETMSRNADETILVLNPDDPREGIFRSFIFSGEYVGEYIMKITLWTGLGDAVSFGSHVELVDVDWYNRGIVFLRHSNRGQTFRINDALAILKHLALLEPLTPEQVEMYDFYDTGNITIHNALEILKYLAKLENVIG
jgi:hypothetical protein